jgi:hypothetical protein
MTHLVVLFNDTAALADKLNELVVTQGSHLDLLYSAPNRPSRMKRWVSRNGWQRLATERGRKLMASTEPRITALGATYEVHAVVGDALQMATEMSRNTNSRMIDARASRFDLPTLDDLGEAAQATADASVKFSAAVASSISPTAVEVHTPKVIYKSSLKRSYSPG